MDTYQTTILYILTILQFTSLTQVDGFKCQSCSYAWSKDDPNADTACINQPDVFTGWQTLECDNHCVVQETYNTVLQKVVAYWRSCTDKPESDYCIGEKMLTCVYTCQGDFCNSWVRGQLHQLFSKNAAITTPKADRIIMAVSLLLLWICSALRHQ